MILSDSAIRAAMKRGDIVIDPFRDRQLGPNSYDVRLAKTLLRCEETMHPYLQPSYLAPATIDAKKEQIWAQYTIPSEGEVLEPGWLYLGVTEEYTETQNLIPYLDGKSSIGRRGVFVHCTAGRGDADFKGHWTLEISVVQPVRVYVGMPIGQLTYHAIVGEVERPYSKIGNYNNKRQENPQPVPAKPYVSTGDE